jgi:hypothetical protein
MPRDIEGMPAGAAGRRPPACAPPCAAGATARPPWLRLHAVYSICGRLGPPAAVIIRHGCFLPGPSPDAIAGHRRVAVGGPAGRAGHRARVRFGRLDTFRLGETPGGPGGVSASKCGVAGGPARGSEGTTESESGGPGRAVVSCTQ